MRSEHHADTILDTSEGQAVARGPVEVNIEMATEPNSEASIGTRMSAAR